MTEPAKLNKSRVNYRPSVGEKRCGNCSMYRDHTCTLVKGSIRPDDVCDRWQVK